jgi:hypothetical protein
MVLLNIEHLINFLKGLKQQEKEIVQIAENNNIDLHIHFDVSDHLLASLDIFCEEHEEEPKTFNIVYKFLQPDTHKILDTNTASQANLIPGADLIKNNIRQIVESINAYRNDFGTYKNEIESLTVDQFCEIRKQFHFTTIIDTWAYLSLKAGTDSDALIAFLFENAPLLSEKYPGKDEILDDIMNKLKFTNYPHDSIKYKGSFYDYWDRCIGRGVLFTNDYLNLLAGCLDIVNWYKQHKKPYHAIATLEYWQYIGHNYQSMLGEVYEDQTIGIADSEIGLIYDDLADLYIQVGDLNKSIETYKTYYDKLTPNDPTRMEILVKINNIEKELGEWNTEREKRLYNTNTKLVEEINRYKHFYDLQESQIEKLPSKIIECYPKIRQHIENDLVNINNFDKLPTNIKRRIIDSKLSFQIGIYPWAITQLSNTIEELFQEVTAKINSQAAKIWLRNHAESFKQYGILSCGDILKLFTSEKTIQEFRNLCKMSIPSLGLNFTYFESSPFTKKLEKIRKFRIKSVHPEPFSPDDINELGDFFKKEVDPFLSNLLEVFYTGKKYS